jgi:hypothetical protein
MNYPFNIPSIAQLHAPLGNNPNFINDPMFQGVHAATAAGAPLDPLAVKDAENTVGAVSAAKCESLYSLLRIHN